jgi:radical SAM protein with 4Fe4S-binding SPASM domain
VVVWNCTSRCNLACRHCYASAISGQADETMDTAAGKRFIDGLADFGVPVILFSGGEPMMRPDLFELASYAAEKGLRIALSTNGTLIDDNKADLISRIGFAEVGISLDGTRATNDHFRGQAGAYDEALQGIRACVNRGVRVSLRLTITSHNHKELSDMFRLVEDEGINRVCFYHLAYSGRGSKMQSHDVTHNQTRAAVDTICAHTLDLHQRRIEKEVLTVANHADGVYLYLKTLGEDPARSGKIMDLLQQNGGNNSGLRIAAVGHDGSVHPDQFWQTRSVGNVLQRSFGDIWSDESQPLLRNLRNRKNLLKGRCARCRYLDVCNGNLRARAEAVYGDPWEQDPACYLSDEEIAA